MKNLMLLAGILLFAGCATPTERITTWDPKTGRKIKCIEKFDNSTFRDNKVIGLRLDYDPDTYSPSIKLLYGRACSARISRGQKFGDRFTTKNMNLFSLSGETDHVVYFESDMVKDKNTEAIAK